MFTTGLDRWWPRKASIGKAPLKTSVLELRLNGRWYQIGEDGSRADVGKILGGNYARVFAASVG